MRDYSYEVECKKRTRLAIFAVVLIAALCFFNVMVRVINASIHTADQALHQVQQ